MNRLYYGDCLTVMQDMRMSCVDLIYLDPPFNSNREYNAIYKDETGRPLPDQIEAFCDLWVLDEERERAVRQMPILMRSAGVEDEVAQFWQLWTNALRKTQPRLLAYLSYMTERLLPMRGLLKPTGSIYLHCDPTASHYIKIMMDGIFGHANFRREIVWSNEDTSGFKSQAKNWIRGHDTILYYTRGSATTFHKEYLPLDAATVRRYDKVDAAGRAYKIYRQSGGGERRSYLRADRGAPISSVWKDIRSFQTVNNTGEYLGYATQKPLTLLDRIIRASSNEGDVVFDPFCGCATTLEAAHHLKRRWIGIDIAIHAVKRVAKVRLQDRLGLVEGEDFAIDGVPRNIEGARDLWERDKYHFQKWAVEQVDGFVTTKRTADGGIDGRLYFALPDTPDLRSMALEVKGGANVTIADVRALHGVLERDEAAMAGLIVMADPAARKRANFAREMASAGDLAVLGRAYPRMQLLTVPEIIEGKRFDTPSVVGRGDRTPVLPRSGRTRRRRDHSPDLFPDE